MTSTYEEGSDEEIHSQAISTELFVISPNVGQNFPLECEQGKHNSGKNKKGNKSKPQAEEWRARAHVVHRKLIRNNLHLMAMFVSLKYRGKWNLYDVFERSDVNLWLAGILLQTFTDLLHFLSDRSMTCHNEQTLESCVIIDSNRFRSLWEARNNPQVIWKAIGTALNEDEVNIPIDHRFGSPTTALCLITMWRARVQGNA